MFDPFKKGTKAVLGNSQNCSIVQQIIFVYLSSFKTETKVVVGNDQFRLLPTTIFVPLLIG